jgi:antitoxin component YwqK of YwqJK toxin-antitoxin module
MKFFYITLILLITISVSAQNINQFDADGKRHGIWKKTFDKTSVLRYEGAFNHGKEIGEFKFYKNIDRKALLAVSKIFNDSNTVANVKFYTPKGKLISEGQMDSKLYIGAWKYYQKNTDRLIILEHYDTSGNLEGSRMVYYKNGQIAEQQNYKNGKLEGESIWYSENGVVLKHFIYANGELHGLSKYYNPKAELITEGNYKNGKKDGIWKFYADGKFKEEKDFTYKNKKKSLE